MKKPGLLILILFLFVPALFAQNGLIRGKVVLTNPNGSTATITGAKVELYRTDIWGKMPATYTDNSGEFIFVGLQVAGTYLVAVSGQGLEPNGAMGVKAGNENLIIKVEPGTGGAYSEQTIKRTVELTQLKKQEAEDFKAANQLFNEKKYQAAVAAYDAIIKKYLVGELEKDVHRQRAIALNNLAIEAYNDANQSKNDAERLQLFEKAKKYSIEAVSSAASSEVKHRFEAEKPGHKPTEDFKAKRAASNFILLEALRLGVLIRKDAGLLPHMKTALDRYLPLGLTSVDRAQALNMYAETLLSLGVWDQASTQYALYLKEFPNDFEAFFHYAKSLLGQSIGQENEAARNETLQTSADYFQRFLDAAPANHNSRAATGDGLKYIKENYKITPKASAPKQPVKPPVADSDIVSTSQVKDVKYSDPFYGDLQSLIERYGITGLTYGGEFRPSEKLLVSSYEDISGEGLATLKRMALTNNLEPAEVFGLVCSLQSPVYVIDSDAIQHLNCLYGIKLPDPPGKVKELTRGEFATLFSQALGLATKKIADMKPRPKNALGMWRITLTFKEGTQTYFLSLEKQNTVSGGKMFEIQGSNFDIKNFRQVGKTVSFTAIFGTVPITFRGTVDAALMNMKGSFTGIEKGKRITATWTAARDMPR